MAFPDPRFFRSPGPIDPNTAALLCEGRLTRQGGQPITTVAEASVGGEGAAAFAETVSDDLAAVSVLLVPVGMSENVPSNVQSVIETSSPRLGFAKIATALFESRSDLPFEDELPEASIHKTARVHPAAVIGRGAVIGEGAVIGPCAVIGPSVDIGAHCRIGAHASITHAVLGAHCHISAGARIGEAGFGYTADKTGPYHLPQLGKVVLGHAVDIGANTTIDRGMLTDTVLGDGCKIDNLCQIGHNCRLGRAVLVASQTGISGSCVIGDGVMMGGQVGMADHLTIGDGAVLAAKAGLMKDVEPGGKVGGSPAKPVRQWMKETATLSRLAGKNHDG